jgi:hypothetical protein
VKLNGILVCKLLSNKKNRTVDDPVRQHVDDREGREPYRVDPVWQYVARGCWLIEREEDRTVLIPSGSMSTFTPHISFGAGGGLQR